MIKVWKKKKIYRFFFFLNTFCNLIIVEFQHELQPKKTTYIKWWKKNHHYNNTHKGKKPKKNKKTMQFKNILLFFFTKIFGGSVCDYDNNEAIRCTYEIHHAFNSKRDWEMGAGAMSELSRKAPNAPPPPWGNVGGVLGVILWNRVRDEHIGQEWLQHHWLLYSPFNGFHPITLMKFVICWKHYIVYESCKVEQMWHKICWKNV